MLQNYIEYAIHNASIVVRCSVQQKSFGSIDSDDIIIRLENYDIIILVSNLIAIN